MVDVTQGVERVRVWPKKRGKPKDPRVAEQNEWFRQAQWACKYWPASLQATVRAAVAGTPLMPRDLQTMIMAGRLLAIDIPGYGTIWSIAAMNDVSKSLDVISPNPGDVLTRGAEYWQAAAEPAAGYVLTWQGPDEPAKWTPKGGGGGGTWAVAGYWNAAIDGPSATVDFTDLAGAGEIMIVTRNTTRSASTVDVLRVSTNNGASFFAGTTDYKSLSTAGVEADSTGAQIIGTNATAARSGQAVVVGCNLSGPPRLIHVYGREGANRYFVASSDPINAVRVQPTSAATITGGEIWCLTR